MAKDQQFHEDRLKGLGGSDVGRLFNMGFGCRRSLHYEKGRVPPDFPRDDDDNRHTRRGTALEPIAADLYEQATGRVVKAVGQHQHETQPHLVVHADRLVEPAEGAGFADWGALEIKCPSVDVFRSWEKDGPPDYYQAQLQHAMLVWGLKWGSFFAFNAELWEFISVDYQADERLHREILADSAQFYSNALVRGLPPPRLERGDRRCRTCPWRTTCWGEEGEAWRPDPKQAVEDDPEFNALLTNYRRVDERLAAVEAQHRAARAEISAVLGRRTKVVLAEGTVLRQDSSKRYIPLYAVQELAPDLFPKVVRSHTTSGIQIRLKKDNPKE